MIKRQIDVSIVIACYNAAKILEESVREIQEILDVTKYSYEIIFIDDKSMDNTIGVAKRLCKKYKNMTLICHKKNMGRGRTVADGIKYARGRIAGFLDIDLETHARYIPSFAIAINKGADIAVAWRVYRIRLNTLHRWILSKGYLRLVRKICGIPHSPFVDTESGFKFFNREAILPVLKETTDTHWFWDTEVIVRSYYRGLKIVEIPTLFLKRFDVPSSVKLFRDTIDYFIKLIKFRKVVKELQRKKRDVNKGLSNNL